MESRTDIKIVILGEKNSGRQTLIRTLFLSDHTMIKSLPLSLISNVYFEIDEADAYRLDLILECKLQKKKILSLDKIGDLEELRNNDILPLLYKHVLPVKGLINCDVNPFIRLTYYFIGNNFRDYSKEINNANILIYITDINQKINGGSELLNYIFDICKDNSNKHLIVLANKDEFSINRKFFIREFNEFAEKKEINNYKCIPISIKYSQLIRFIDQNHDCTLDETDKKYFVQLLNKKEISKIKKSTIFDNQKYLLEACGYRHFESNLSNIISENYKKMLNYNFTLLISEIPIRFKTLINSKKSVINTYLSRIKNLAKKLDENKLNGTDSNLNNLIMAIRDFIANFSLINPDIGTQKNILSTIFSVFNDKKIKKQIRNLEYMISNKYINQLLDIINNSTSFESFMPTTIYPIINDIIKYKHNPSDVIKIRNIMCMLCDIYGNFFRKKICVSADNLYKYINYYFSNEQVSKLIIILKNIKSYIPSDEFEYYLLNILFAKLKIMETYIYTDGDPYNLVTDSKLMFIDYCDSLRHYLSKITTEKYYYLFNRIGSICEIYSRILGYKLTIDFIADNIEQYISIKENKIIDLETFIITTLSSDEYYDAIV